MLTRKGLTSRVGLKSFSGLQSYRGLRNRRGVTIPKGAKWYYAYYQPNLTDAITEQVNGIAQVTTTRASAINIPQTAGGTLEFAAGEAAFDVGQNMQVRPSKANIAKYSQYSASNWDFIDSIAADSGDSPITGVKYTRLSPDGTGSKTVVAYSNSSGSIVAGETYTTIVATKSNPNGYLQIASGAGFVDAQAYANFRLSDGAVGSFGAISSNVKSFVIGDLIYAMVSFTASAGGVNKFNDIVLLKSDIASRLPTEVFDGTEYLDFCYYGLFSGELNNPEIILTNGSPVTRPDTRAQISMLDNPSWMIDSPSDNGGVNPCVLGDLQTSGYTNGVTGTTSGYITFNGTTINGKYFAAMGAAIQNVLFIASNGDIMMLGPILNASTAPYVMLKGVAQSFENDGTSSNHFTVLFAYSDYNTDFSAVKTFRESLIVPDDLTGWSTPTLISDNAGGFKIELDVPDLDHNTGSCVLWKSGDASLEYDATAGELQSKVAANTAVLALPDLLAAQKVAFKYDGTNIYASADDVDGIGTATTAPVLDATGDILQDGAGGGYADVPKVKAIYGGDI